MTSPSCGIMQSVSTTELTGAITAWDLSEKTEHWLSIAVAGEVIPEKVSGKARMEAVPLKKAYGEGGLNLHVKNHLECIKSRNRNCNASIEIGAHIAKFSQLGNIAYRTGKKLTWDGKSFHDAEADKYLCKEYRTPWELPKI